MEPIVLVNWKQEIKNLTSAKSLFRKYKTLIPLKGKYLFVAAPFSFVYPLQNEFRSKKYILGVQDVSVGEIGKDTAEQIKSVGAKFAFASHPSYDPSNLQAKEKIVALSEADIIPIVFIGEDIRDKKGTHYSQISEQLINSFRNVGGEIIQKSIIVYEPHWVKDCNGSINEFLTSTDFVTTIAFIRKTLSKLSNNKIAKNVYILYGGCVNKSNVVYLLDKGLNGVALSRSGLDPYSLKYIVSVWNKK